MSLSKKILEEEIKKTRETIQTIETMRKESKKKGEQIEEDCKVGLEVNNFVLEKLEEAYA